MKATQIGGDGGLSTDRGRGANSFLTDKVRGSTSGKLTLEQRAIAGDSGISAGGAAASSNLTATNPGGGNLVGTSYSEAGNFGSAHSQISLIGAKDVTATAEAIGGSGSGKGVIGVVYGESTDGGRVEVTGIATDGNGVSIVNNGSNAGSVTNVSLNNRVDGVTSGELVLRQVANAGNGGGLTTTFQGFFEPDPDFSGSGINGPKSGGDAASILSRTTSSQSLNVMSEANGGRGGDGISIFTTQAWDGADGGGAVSESNPINNSGTAIATAIANGGSGGKTRVHAQQGQSGPSEFSSNVNFRRGGSGGRAEATANSQSFGDNNNAEAYSTARGGVAGNIGGDQGGRPGEFGGDATSNATALAHGNSGVIVQSEAFGGNIGNGLRHVNLPSSGGDAIANAEGRSLQGGNVNVTSYAQGGGALIPTSREFGGDAEASSTAISTIGQVDAFSRAVGGGAKESGGHASTVSSATSRNIVRMETKAEAARSQSETGRRNAGEAEAFSSVGGTMRNRVSRNSYAHAVALPQQSDITNILTGNTNVSDALNLGATGNELFLLGSMGLTKTEETNAENIFSPVWSASIDLGIDMDSLTSGQELFVGLLNPESTGTGIFEDLIFEIAVEGTIFESSQFITAAGADVFFDDQVINLGHWESFTAISSDNILDLMFTFEMRTDDFNGYNFDLVAGTTSAVPLPPAVWFLISGIATLLGFSRKKTVH